MTYDIHSSGGTQGAGGGHEGPRPFAGLDLPLRPTRAQRLMKLAVTVLFVLLVLGVALVALSFHMRNAELRRALEARRGEYVPPAETDGPDEAEEPLPAAPAERPVTNYVERAVPVEVVVEVPVTNVVVKPHVVVVEVPVTNVVVRPCEVTVEYPVTNVVVHPFQVIVDQVVTNYVRLGGAAEGQAEPRPASSVTGTFRVAPVERIVPVAAVAPVERAEPVAAVVPVGRAEPVAAVAPVVERRPIRVMTPYRVRWGDTVTGLAVQYSFRVPDFKVCNPGVDIEYIRAGQVVQLPGDVTIVPEVIE